MPEETEWGRNDSARAEALYSMRGYTKLFFDLLMDQPGKRIDTNQIVAYFTQRRPKGSKVPNGLAVGGSLTPIGKRCRKFGWQLPYERLQSANSASSDYVMEPTVARLFRKARMKVNPSYAGNTRGTDWSSTDVRAIVADYLAMLADEV